MLKQQVDPDSHAAISAEAVEQFHRDGYVIVESVVSPRRVEALRQAFDELLEQWAADCGVTRDRYLEVVSQWTNLWQRDPAFATQLHHPRVVAIARTLLAVRSVRVFHDHVIYKPPRTGGYVSGTIPWHQDFAFWPVDQPRALSCWLALDDVSAETGAMRMMPGAHRDGVQPPVDFLRAPRDWGSREDEAHTLELSAGSAVFHSCLSWHMSPPNSSPRPRRAYITIMLDSDARWRPEAAPWHPMNQRVTVAPGEPFNDDGFPLLDPGNGAGQEVA